MLYGEAAILRYQVARTDILLPSVVHQHEQQRYPRCDLVRVTALLERRVPGETVSAATLRAPSSLGCFGPSLIQYSTVTRLFGAQSVVEYVFQARRVHVPLHGNSDSTKRDLATSVVTAAVVPLRQRWHDHQAHRLQASDFPHQSLQCPNNNQAVRAAIAIQNPIITPITAASNNERRSIRLKTRGSAATTSPSKSET